MPGRLITIPHLLVLIKVQFGLIIGRRRQQIPPEIHLLIPIPTMIHLFLQLLPIWQQAIPSVKLDIILGKQPHGLEHLTVGFEVQEESTFRVDEVEEVMRGDVLQRYFGLEDQAVQEVHWCWRHRRADIISKYYGWAGISSAQLLCVEGTDLGHYFYAVVRDQTSVNGVQFFGETSDGVAGLVSITSYVFRIAVCTIQPITDRLLSPGEMMNRVRSSIQNPLKREHIDIVVYANRPQTSQKPMEENDIDRNRHEVATGEHGHSLDEGIQGMEGKSSERRHCFGLVMDEMQVSVYFGMVEQPMEPVGQKLIVKDMDEQVQRQERRDLE